MKILIAGETGYIGSHVKRTLIKQGHEVDGFKIPRPDKKVAHLRHEWEQVWSGVDSHVFEGYDAFYYLGGESINGYWSKKKKARMYNSRVVVCELIAKKVRECRNPPPLVITSSAVGIYGTRGNEKLTEESKPGTNFLARLAIDWENAWQALEGLSTRIVFVRTAVVLGPDAMMLKMILPVFKLGIGGKLGDGQQWLSWIHRDDLAEIFALPITNKKIQGPINGCAPNPVTNNEFTRELGAVLNRPTLITVPKIAIKFGFGQMGEETIMGSCRALPEIALRNGFTFKFAHVNQALKDSV